MSKAAFLDRDGVINRKAPDGHYITRWEDFEFLPRVAEAIRLLERGGFSVIVVSNQRCVAKGLLTIAELELIHQRMRKQLAAADAVLTAVYYCPHDNGQSCSCRKPAPGMLFQAAREHGIDLASSWMVGDSDIDMEAGKAAGCRTVRVLTNGTLSEIAGDLTAHSLFEAAQQLIQLGRTS
jgi:D-glycero-D-manno-heptose 1,7-bisphosphate phosphatase